MGRGVSDHDRFSDREKMQNHENLIFDIFEYAVGSLFLDSFRLPGRPLELSNRWVSALRPLRRLVRPMMIGFARPETREAMDWDFGDAGASVRVPDIALGRRVSYDQRYV